MEAPTVLAARRSYEFALDGIRLPLVCNRHAINYIVEALGFEQGEVVAPGQSFGPVTPSYPPGLVFQFGALLTPDGGTIPIRFINFEPTRIVIDVGASSRKIDIVFSYLRELLSENRTAEGLPVFDEPIGTYDVSELNSPAGFEPSAFVTEQVASVLSQALDVAPEDGRIAVAALQFRMVNPNQAYLGASTPYNETYFFDLRAGAQPGEKIYYSFAPLDSDRHVALFEKLREAFTAS